MAVISGVEFRPGKDRHIRWTLKRNLPYPLQRRVV